MPTIQSSPLQTRLAPVTSVQADARVFRTCWTTGAQVRRWDWWTGRAYLEELVVDESAIDLSRFESGLSLLKSHRSWSLDDVLGVAQRGWIEDGQGLSDLLFSDRDQRMAGYWRDITQGILRLISVGYSVQAWEVTDPVNDGDLQIRRAVHWTPHEQSLCPINADAAATVRSAGERETRSPGGLVLPQGVQDWRQMAPEDRVRAAAGHVGGRVFDAEVYHRSGIQVPVSATGAAVARQQPPADPAPTTDSVQPPQQQQQRTAVTPPPSTPTSASGLIPEERAMPQPTDPVHTPATPATPDITAEQRAAIIEAERARASGIRQMATTLRRSVQGDIAGLADADIDAMLTGGLTLDQARARAFESLARHSEATSSRSPANIQTVQDEQETRRSLMSEALQHRGMGAPLDAQGRRQAMSDGARQYRGMSLMEMARRSLEAQGVRVQDLTPTEVAQSALGMGGGLGRAMIGTPDLAVALANTVNRTLRSGYESAGRSFVRWARQGSLNDFRPATRVAVSAALKLEKTNEFGEFKSGALTDSGETIQLATWGKKIAITRQVIINDDIDMLARLPAQFGRAAADLESRLVYGVLTGNAALSDGVALFHANHANLAAAGGAISEDTLSAGRKALRLQTDPGSKEPLDLVARFIIVPPSLETAAQKMFTAVISSKATDVNVFQNSYEIVTEARLEAASSTAWYLAADPSLIDTIEYAYLAGEAGLQTEERIGFDTDGIEIKGRLDFAAKAIDHRGLYRNPGA